VVIDVTVSAVDFVDEFVVFELDNRGLGTSDFLAEVLWARDGLVVAIDVVDGLETNNVLVGVDNNEFLDSERGTRELGEEWLVVEVHGITVVLANEKVFRTAPHRYMFGLVV